MYKTHITCVMIYMYIFFYLQLSDDFWFYSLQQTDTDVQRLTSPLDGSKSGGHLSLDHATVQLGCIRRITKHIIPCQKQQLLLKSISLGCTCVKCVPAERILPWEHGSLDAWLYGEVPAMSPAHLWSLNHCTCSVQCKENSPSVL